MADVIADVTVVIGEGESTKAYRDGFGDVVLLLAADLRVKVAESDVDRWMADMRLNVREARDMPVAS